MRRASIWLILPAVAFILAGCAQPDRMPDYTRPLPPGAVALEPVDTMSEIPSFAGAISNKQALLTAIDHSLDYFTHPSSEKYYPYLDVTHARAVHSLELFRQVVDAASTDDELDSMLRHYFVAYRSVGWDGQGSMLYTAYCEPIYNASLTRDASYKYPLYKLPADLVKDPEGKPLGRRTADGGIVSYYTRQQIEQGDLLAGQELIYLNDPFNAYVVHVQGSARLRLPDGTFYSVGYAGKTDRDYVSIGGLMLEDGTLTREIYGLQSIRDYFRKRPDQLEKYTFQNESYVFFTHTEGGPYGSLGVPVTTNHSLATDKSVFPRGCLTFVSTTAPRRTGVGSVEMVPFKGFLLDQDTGAAIRAAGRADIFMGTGPEAEALAGRMSQEGLLYYLFAKEPEPGDFE